MNETYPYVVHDDENIKGFFGEYRFLSNFHPAQVRYEGIYYTSVEGAYQAAKPLDLGVRKDISLMSAGQAKRAGGKVVMRPDWETLIPDSEKLTVKIDTMRELVLDKFSRNPDLKTLLLATGDKHLEETNHWHDAFWELIYPQA